MSLGRDLLETLDRWEAPDPEAAFRRAAWRALASDTSLLTRDGHPAHFTASALPLTADGRRVCLALHARLGSWVQPGGHLEGSDRSVPEAAGREMIEETGLEGRIDPVPVGLSRHPAPCRSGAWHLDVQFLAVTEPHRPVVSEESRRVAWFPVDQLPEGLAPGVVELVEAARERLSRSAPPVPPRPGD